WRLLGRAAFVLGRLDDARRLGDRAVEASPQQLAFKAHALHLLGDIAAHRDWFDAEIAEGHYRQALALAEPLDMRPLVAHCNLGLGKLLRHTSNRQEAKKHLTTAIMMYREMGMNFYLERGGAESEEFDSQASSS